jgi:hypothetical protein
VNEKDIRELSLDVAYFRPDPKRPNWHFPERSVLPCDHCAEGKVILTRKMLEERARG